jgi:hypothetical protein
MWRFYSSHRKALFRVIKTLDVRSTTSDQTLIDAMNFIIAHEHDPKKYLEATIDLSFASEKWQRTVLVRRKRKSWFLRQHLETCVFSYVAEELKTGDLCVAGSEQFADYRDQLLSWQECEPKLAAYCQQLGFPLTPEGFVAHLRTWLTDVASLVDRTRPQNHELMITEKGEPALKKLRAKAPPVTLAQLEEALAEKIPERHLLEVLARIDHVTGFTRHFGPLSGSEPKIADARERYLLTIFAYGTPSAPIRWLAISRGFSLPISLPISTTAISPWRTWRRRCAISLIASIASPCRATGAMRSGWRPMGRSTIWRKRTCSLRNTSGMAGSEALPIIM